MQKDPSLKMSECVKSIILKEGPFAFYKGMALDLIYLGTLSPLSGIAACTSIQFGANEVAKRYFSTHNKINSVPNPESLSVSQYVLGGVFAGAANTVVAAPVEHIRIVMQVNLIKQRHFDKKGDFHNY